MDQITPPWLAGNVAVAEQPVDAPEAQPPVKRRGFAPGVSGNPQGKKPGTLNHKTRMRQRFEEHGGAVGEVVLQKALEGDISCCHLVMTRVYPPLRPKSEPVQFTLEPGLTIQEQGAAIMSACARGELDVDSARSLIGCLSTLAGLKIDELDERMAALEEKLALRGLR